MQMIPYGSSNVKMSDVLSSAGTTIDSRSVEWRSHVYGYATEINGWYLFVKCLRNGRWTVHIGASEHNLNFTGIECTSLDHAKEAALARAVKNG